MEWKRIFTQKKLIAICILLFILNIGIFIRGEVTNPWKISEQEQLIQSEEYIATYYERLEQIEEKAKQLQSISIFANEDSFAKKDIQKSNKDFQNLTSISLKAGKDRAITSLMEYKMGHYILLLFVIIFVFQLDAEREKGLWTLIHTTKKGRLRLGIQKGVLLTVSVFLYTVLTYLGLVISSFVLYGGEDNLLRSIQSIPIFKDFTALMSIFEYICYYIWVNSISLICIGLFLWFILSLCSSKQIATLLIGMIFGLEFMLSRFLPIQSYFSFFKYVNYFSYIDITEVFTSYRNLPFGLGIISRQQLMLYSMFALSGICAIGCLVIYHYKKPVRSTNWLENKLNQIAEQVRRVTEYFPVFLSELYKIIACQRGFILILVLIVIMFQSAKKQDFYYTAEEKFIQSLYSDLGGPLDDSKKGKIEELKRNNHAIENHYFDIKEKYETDKIGMDVFEEAQSKYEAIMPKINGQKYFEKERKRLENITYKDNKVQWYVNPNGYEKLYGKETFYDREIKALSALLFLVLLCSGIFSFEKQCGTTFMLRISQKGRRELFISKIMISMLLTTIVWATFFVMEIYQVNLTFGLSGWDAPLHSVKLLQYIPYKGTIRGFTCFVLFMEWFLLWMCSLIVIGISSLKTTRNTLLYSIVLLLLPSLGYLIEIPLMKAFALVKPLAALRYFLGARPNIGHYILYVIVIILLGFGSLFISYKKWCFNTWKK